MIRAVLDTNVLVSAMISPFGNEALILSAVQHGKITPCLSQEIVQEYADVLARPRFRFAPDEIAGLIQMITTRGLMFQPPSSEGRSPDPGDESFIACAMQAEAQFLVTGNKRHFPQESCEPTKVVSARELIDSLNTPQSP